MKILSEFDKGWLTGFVEGEGSFFISLSVFNKNSDKPRFQFSLGFKISLAAVDKEVIYKIRNLTEIGHINFKSKVLWIKHGLTNSQDQFSFKVENITECRKLTYILDENLFKGSKKSDFLLWKEALIMFENYEHLTKQGMLKLCDLRAKMNGGVKNKNYLTKEFVGVLIRKREDMFTSEQIQKRKLIAMKSRNWSQIICR